ncbi:uncharacterized protein LOC110430327 isoform X2 [Sorghum bicolor]|uniref:uncharacterized protein LOC110430327 isoform X2 n=1 Tax=Sorghum bicolor TaxID=4558 RepID=UPI000B424A5C|nr:uncharacterized protein LOC110430327 isoform X2 [Sorghum bicolor]|eukprot:XP_021303548.1 uncharacterized protein LOC110430327 isoform X2 [Sorghum bicolor]
MEVRVPKRKVDLVLGWPFPMHPSSLLAVSTELQQTKAVCFISPVTSTQAIDKISLANIINHRWIACSGKWSTTIPIEPLQYVHSYVVFCQSCSGKWSTAVPIEPIRWFKILLVVCSKSSTSCQWTRAQEQSISHNLSMFGWRLCDIRCADQCLPILKISTLHSQYFTPMVENKKNNNPIANSLMGAALVETVCGYYVPADTHSCIQSWFLAYR